MKTLLTIALIMLNVPLASASGLVERQTFESAALGVRKAYRIYLPDGYSAGMQRYPVIYLLHGWGVTEDSWIGPTLDLPAAADAMKLQAIVVMPDGDRSLYINSLDKVDYDACLNDANPPRNKREKREEFCVRFPRYEDYIVKDLIRHIDDTYRTLAQRGGRALTGESAGGNGAMQLALRHKDMFSSVASHSGGLSLLYDGPHPYVKDKVVLLSTITPDPRRRDAQEILGGDIDNWRAHDPLSLAETLHDGELAIYVDCGAQDEYGFNDQALFFHDRLLELGIQHDFELPEGKHDDGLWKQQIKRSLQFHVRQFKKNETYQDF